jgi:hypothetical protein
MSKSVSAKSSRRPTLREVRELDERIESLIKICRGLREELAALERRTNRVRLECSEDYIWPWISRARVRRILRGEEK